MKRTLLLFGAVFCTIGLAFSAHGDEVVEEPEPVASAILLFEPDLFAVPSSVALPEWIARVGYEGGEVGGGTSAWHVAESAPAGMGKLWVELDRSVLDENLAVSVVSDRQVPSDMVIQLWDAQDQVVALDLFGNIAAAALESRTDTFVVPLWKYPSATRIVLRRVSGATTIYGLALIPVVMERDIGPDTVEALQFARMLGDRLSPENELVRRVRVIANGRAAAGSTGRQDEASVVVAPARALANEPVAADASSPHAGVQWNAGTPFPRACGMLAATVADGKIYAMGGYNGSWNSHVFMFDPEKPGQGWMGLSNMPMGRACLAAVTAGGKIYSIGGQGTENDPAAVFALDPNQPDRGWEQVSSLPVGLLRHAAVAVNEKIYVMGGLSAKGSESALYEYDTQQPEKGWRLINSMPVALSSLSATVLDGKIYVIGGHTGSGFISAVYVFDTKAPEQGWGIAGTLPEPRYVVAPVTVGKRIYAVGGFNASQTGIKTVYMYDSLKPDQGWVSVNDLPEVKGEAPGVVVDGKVYVISGAVAPCTYRPTVYVGTLD